MNNLKREISYFTFGNYSDKKTALLELVDGAYDIIEIWPAETPAQKQWKENWLKKARELGANPNI